jgi:cytochrome c peroxidase
MLPSVLLALAPLLPAPSQGPSREVDARALAQRLHERVHDESVFQEELTRFLELGLGPAGFRWGFAQGEELFEAEYSILDGGGANVGGGQRYTRVPRADLSGSGEWATHVPPRTTGPNAASCVACHDTPANDGSGGAAANVQRDPFRTGRLADMIQRNAPHLFGAGAVQRLAEEMSAELGRLRDEAAERVRRTGRAESVTLVSKSIDFGVLRLAPGEGGSLAQDASSVRGIDADLVVRPFGWKGDTASLRAFTRKALHEELGLQAVELVGERDGDHDGVRGEFTVGDVTALTLYVAGQPRPTTRVELAELGLLPPLAEKELERIRRGEEHFRAVGCATCHVPELVLHDSRFREPSALVAFRDERFPAGQDPLALGVDPNAPLAIRLCEDLPDNVLDEEGTEPRSFGNLVEREHGVVVALYGDLKRHDLGPGLAEAVDETGTGAATFLTENLWGVGSTAPYLHDGRATTLAEAIHFHGGEAAAARAAFLALTPVQQLELVTFLESLVLFKLERVPQGPGG